MPQIPQISGPMTGGKTMTSANSTPSGGEPFSLDGVNAVQKTAGVVQKGGASAGNVNQGVDNEASAAINLQAAKDPAMAVETLHDVFSGDLLENAKLNGYTELAGEIDDLTKAIYINPDKLMNEILTQEKDNTVFAGNELFEILRNLCGESGEDTKELVANLLKTLNYAMSRNDILSAITSNIKFLSEYFGKNTSLSKSLTQLYEHWTEGDPSENFEALKNETAALMRTISGSLQNDSRTETLVPLVTHNLSRYNTNEYMMKEAFSQLMSQVPSASMREGLNRSFTSFVKSLLSNTNDPYSNNTTNTVENQVSTKNFDVSAEKTAILIYLSKLAGTSETAAQTVHGAENAAEGAEEASSEAANSENAAQAAENPENVENEAVSQAGNTLREAEAENLQAEKGNEAAGNEKSETSAPLEKGAANSVKGQIESSYDEKNRAVLDSYRRTVPLSESRIGFVLSNFNDGLTSGRDAIGQLLSLLIPRGDNDAADVMQTAANGIDNLAEMVNFLNKVLENIPDIPERQSICDAFEEIVGTMARNHELPTQKASGYESETMKALTAFIDRNVNHPAIRGIDNFNAANLLQSMLNAPGVFTPLAHYIIPLQVENTRAFGELWVDNDNTSKNSGENGEKQFHLFLTFDVEAVGRFEVNAYSSGKDLTLSVLYPKSYRSRVSGLTEKITKIAAGVGFNVQDFKTGILIKPHTLAETFPRIRENRKSFDVTA